MSYDKSRVNRHLYSYSIINNSQEHLFWLVTRYSYSGVPALFPVREKNSEP